MRASRTEMSNPSHAYINTVLSTPCVPFPAPNSPQDGIQDRARLHWVDILGRRLFSSDLDATVTRTTDLPQMPGFAVPDVAGGWLAAFPMACGTATAVAEWEQLWHAAPAGNPRINDGKTDPQGRVWFGWISLRRGRSPVRALGAAFVVHPTYFNLQQLG